MKAGKLSNLMIAAAAMRMDTPMFSNLMEMINPDLVWGSFCSNRCAAPRTPPLLSGCALEGGPTRPLRFYCPRAGSSSSAARRRRGRGPGRQLLLRPALVGRLQGGVAEGVVVAHRLSLRPRRRIYWSIFVTCSLRGKGQHRRHFNWFHAKLTIEDDRVR